MQRYFVMNPENWTESSVIITGEDVHHILRVMRYDVGDQIICINKSGQVAQCEITATENNEIHADIQKWLDVDTELPVQVTIAQGLPKGDKIELVLQKGTELGASHFIPYKAERSIVQWDAKKLPKKIQRFEKIIKEASEQSARNVIPTVTNPYSLHELVTKGKEYDIKLIAYEEEAKSEKYHSLADALKSAEVGMKILICIGPEGGFSDKEVATFKENGFSPVRLGKRILRTETAALYALASVSYHYEELRYGK